MLYEKSIASPVGKLRLIASERGLRYVGFDNSDGRHPALEDEIQPSDSQFVLMKTEKQLDEYFAGARTAFDLPIEFKGTVFQIKAWRALQEIPYGETRSYAQQAASFGDAKKARAVGMANNRNPISIIVPCHRVIGASGALTGYGGGLERKEWLLGLERKVAARAA